MNFHILAFFWYFLMKNVVCVCVTLTPALLFHRSFSTPMLPCGIFLSNCLDQVRLNKIMRRKEQQWYYHHYSHQSGRIKQDPQQISNPWLLEAHVTCKYIQARLTQCINQTSKLGNLIQEAPFLVSFQVSDYLATPGQFCTWQQSALARQ